VLSIEGSCEHVAHPLGWDHVLERWRKHRAHRERWKLVTGGGHTSPWKEPTYRRPFVSQGFTKEEHEGSTLKPVNLRVESSAKDVNPPLTYRASRFRKGGAQGLNMPTREVASCE
jgi:hypothetical protein